MLQIYASKVLENEGGPWKFLKSHGICLAGFGKFWGVMDGW